ncbi:MAG: ABC transporter substrate-binding protein [Deltaproteobacteria bacterium]|nr:ABC transporter substrate-binding protein [Deltaproteobacteria bacterium]
MGGRTRVGWLVALVSLLFGGMPVAWAAEPIRIGMVTPLTGPVAFSGQSQANATKIAMEEINARGGVAGRPIQLFVEDGICNPAQSVAAAEKLINRDQVVALIGAFCSSATGAVMEVTKRYRIPQVTGVSTAPVLTEQGNPWFFRAQATSRLLARAFAPTLVNKEGIRKVAFLVTNEDWGRGMAKEFGEAMTKAGARVASTDFYQVSETDYYSYLTRIKTLGVDALGMTAYETHAIQLSRQIKEVGLKAKLFGEGIWTIDAYLKAAGPYSEGIIALVEYVHTVDNPENRAFVSKYRERHRENPTKYSAAGYLVLQIIAKAISDARSAEPARIRDALEKVEYSGFNGTFRFTPTHQAYDFNVYMVQLRNQVPVVLNVAKIPKP